MSTIDNTIYAKANKIRTKLLLFIDNEIKANKNNKISNEKEDLFEIKLEESFTYREMDGIYFSFNPNPKKLNIFEHVIISLGKKSQNDSHFDSISTVDSSRQENSTFEIGNSKTFSKIPQKPNKKILNINKRKRTSWKRRMINQSCFFIDFLNSDCDFEPKSNKKIKKIKKDKNFLKNLCNNFKNIKKRKKVLASCRNSTKNIEGNINIIEIINENKKTNFNKEVVVYKDIIENFNENNIGKNNFSIKKATKVDSIKQMIRSRKRASTLRYLDKPVKKDSSIFNPKINLGVSKIYSPRKKRIVSFKEN